MSFFICSACGGYADSDDGCEEYGTGLICADCLANYPEIKADYMPLPIPRRDRDWSAVSDDYDGAEDSPTRGQVGFGTTRGEAIRDLIENHLEDVT